MNFDFLNDLIDRLAATEGAKDEKSQMVWAHDECCLEFGHDSSSDDSASVFTCRIQRLPKLTDRDRRPFLIRCSRGSSSGDQEDNTERKWLNDCVCQQQLSYSACLNLVNARQQELSWVEKNDQLAKDEKTQTFSELVRHVWRCLLPCPFLTIRSDDDRQINNLKAQLLTGTCRNVERHPNILVPTCIIESDTWFYAVTSSSDSCKEWVTLWDAAVFHPHVLRDDTDGLLFVVYQLISTLAYCHKEAHFLFDDLRLDAIRINVDDFWCRLDLWRCLQYVAKSLTLKPDGECQWPLGVWCDRWIRGLISNFDYLNVLNDFAGRRAGDPYYHPIFPWICDFTCDPSSDDEKKSNSGGGWRDLTKTKFRLTKGDQQLEQTFVGQHVHVSGSGAGACSTGVGQDAAGRSASISCQAIAAGAAALPPHHVTEFLSDIGYYAYKSRRTPKSILCRHVRHRWVPEEYPSSLRRQYEWTPDEAIPEFYSDPEIFVSIHDDLPDLELPQWLDKTSGTRIEEKFVSWHRTLLESEHVSEHLHSWIDLIFGYQLTGQAAVKAKNVQLRLVERVDRLSNNGVVQLFTKPHPRKQTKKVLSSTTASFDDVMNPLYDVGNLQTVSMEKETVGPEDESLATASPFPTDIWQNVLTRQISQKTSPLVRECLVSLGVFLTELCHSEIFRQLPRYASAEQRFQVAKRAAFNGQTSPLPRCIKFAVEVMLNSNLFISSDNLNSTPAVDPSILCPGFILQPLICLIPFPYYLAPLYDCFRRVRSLEMEYPKEQSYRHGIELDLRSVLDSAEKRVRDVAKLLPLILPHTPLSGVELLARLTKRSLLLGPYTRVLAVWSLWNPLTQALGPALTEKHFLDCLVDFYDVDTPCSAKFLKLYHRTFLLQLSVRLGVKRFLDNFVQPLVEAAAGERDQRFYEDDDEYWKSITSFDKASRSTDVAVVVRRQLSRFSSTAGSGNRDSVPTAVEDSPMVERKREEQQDDADSMVQFQLEIADEGGQLLADRRDSASVDIDASAAAVDEVSIRSSESGFSMGTGGLSSLSISKNEQDDDYGRPKGQQPTQQPSLSVSEVAEESLLWLAHRLGPLLTARHLTKNLLRMLALCYSADRLEPTPFSGDVQSTMFTSSWYSVVGDVGAAKVLHCLEEIAMIYGEHIILRHYFAYAGELIAQALKRLTPNMEMAVLACVALIRRTFPYLTHEQLMENLKDHTFIDTLLFPLIRAGSSIKVTFSSTASRTTLTWKLAECLYWLGVRVGAENVKTYLLVLVQRLFCTYDILYELDPRTSEINEISGVGKSAEWSDAAFVQLKATFTRVLASRMMKAFGALCGRQYLQLSLSNSDLLTRLCSETDVGVGGASATVSDGGMEASSSGYRWVSGVVASDNTKTGRDFEDRSAEVDLVCKRLKHSSRKLKGNWLAYWEYELGRNPKETRFNFKHMKLQTFAGHTGAVKKILALDNENSFFSASHDKTVRLWSLRSTGDGGARTSCQFSYKSHKRPLWDLAFVDSVRLVASVDGSVHIWDPFMGAPLREFEFADFVHDQQQLQQQVHMATIVEAGTAPSSALLVAGTLPVIKFLDVRQAKWAHEFSLGIQRSQAVSGPVRALCVDPSGADRWVAVGHGLGHVSTLDLRTGRVLGQSKVCETDIFAMSAYDKDRFVVCPFDQPLCLVKARDCALQCRVPGTSDAVICMTPYYQELLCATQSNRLRLYASASADTSFADSRLRADVFAGAISTMRVLPLSKLLLLGSTTGNIELLC